MMKITVTKCISALLAAATVAALCAGTGVSAVETEAAHHILSIEIDAETFRDVRQMRCYLYDATDDTELVRWGASAGAMTKDENANVWRFDLDAHGIEPMPAHTYSVIFSDSLTARTEPLTIDSYDPERTYTAVFSEIFTPKAFYTQPEFQYAWSGLYDAQADADVIRLRGEREPFGNDSGRLYCRVYDVTAESDALWFGRMTREEADGVWRFDFGKHGVELAEGHAYTVEFSDGATSSETLTIDAYDREKDYTAVFSGAIVADETGTGYAQCRWADEEPAPPILPAGSGDVDGSGRIDVTDATVIQMAAAKMTTLSAEQERLADTNADGRVDVTDATVIQLYIAGAL